MIIDCPKIRIRDDLNKLIVRDGIVTYFFIRRSHSEIAREVVNTLSKFRTFIGLEKQFWYVDPEGEFQELTDFSYNEILKNALNFERWPHHRILLEDSPFEASGFRFAYYGTWLSDPVFQAWPDVVSVVAFWYPTEFLEIVGVAALKEFTIDIGLKFPFSFGYTSLAFNYSSGDGEFEAFPEIRKMCFRYPGLDVHYATSTLLDIGDRVRGAYWLTLLGKVLLKNMGGVDLIRDNINRSDILVEGLEKDATIVTLSELPEAGDVNRGKFLQRNQCLARILEPYVHTEEIAFPNFSPYDMDRWDRRFLENP